MVDVQTSPRTTTLKPKILVPELGEQVQYLNISSICKANDKLTPAAVLVAELLHGRRFNQVTVNLADDRCTVFVELPMTLLRSRSWLCKVLS